MGEEDDTEPPQRTRIPRALRSIEAAGVAGLLHSALSLAEPASSCRPLIRETAIRRSPTGTTMTPTNAR